MIEMVEADARGQMSSVPDRATESLAKWHCTGEGGRTLTEMNNMYMTTTPDRMSTAPDRAMAMEFLERGRCECAEVVLLENHCLAQNRFFDDGDEALYLLCCVEG